MAHIRTVEERLRDYVAMLAPYYHPRCMPQFCAWCGHGYHMNQYRFIRYATYDKGPVPHTSKYCKWCEAAFAANKPRPQHPPLPHYTLEQLRAKLLAERGGEGFKLTLEHRDRIRQTNLRKRRAKL